MLKQFKPCANQPSSRLLLVTLALIGFLVIYTADANPPVATSGGKSLFAPDANQKVSTDVQNSPIQTKGGVSGNLSRPTASSETYSTKKFNVKRTADDDWETAYYRFLQENRIRPKLIRAKVRRLVRGDPQDLEQAISLIRASLRAGQVQPWMYEALALAMQMNNMPAAEVERVLMSSADFATTPHQLVFLADYMGRLGNHTRALDLLREAALRARGLPEAYAKALALAVYLQDDGAIKWASLGILGQEWQKEESDVTAKARRNAEALLVRLREENKNEEADQFAKQLKEALQRDVVVKVSWSGDADVDLMVEDPTGSICSYRQPRTAGGGVLMGNPNDTLEQSAGAGYAEAYCCPEAFAGDYRILLRQVWGKIPAGRVTVDVWNHSGTEQEIHFRQVIPLDENGAIVTFNLDEGRRNESLADEQIANDITNQLAVNRTILAQQIDAVSDSDVYQSQAAASRLRQPSTIGNRPVFNRSAVGYAPQITVLPIGVTMQANAVVSADRRYVRITCIPFFSHIKGVVQYNIQTGVTEQGQTDAAFADLDIGINDDNENDGDNEDQNTGELLLTIINTNIGVGGCSVAIVSRTGPTQEALTVTVTYDNNLVLVYWPSVQCVPPTVTKITIPAGDSGTVFSISGGSTGTAVIQVTAPGYVADSESMAIN